MLRIFTRSLKRRREEEQKETREKKVEQKKSFLLRWTVAAGTVVPIAPVNYKYWRIMRRPHEINDTNLSAVKRKRKMERKN